MSNDPIFEFDILRDDTARWLDIGQPGTRPVRQTWRTRSWQPPPEASQHARGPQRRASTAAAALNDRDSRLTWVGDNRVA